MWEDADLRETIDIEKASYAVRLLDLFSLFESFFIVRFKRSVEVDRVAKGGYLVASSRTLVTPRDFGSAAAGLSLVFIGPARQRGRFHGGIERHTCKE